MNLFWNNIFNKNSAFKILYRILRNIYHRTNYYKFKILQQKYDNINYRLEEKNSLLDETNRRLEETNRRLEETNRRLEETNRRLEETNSVLDETCNKLNEIKNNLDKKTLLLNRLVNDYVDSKLCNVLRTKNEFHNIGYSNKEVIITETQSKHFSILEYHTVINELKKMDYFYFCPNHGNLGDVIIAEAEYQIFTALKLKYTILDLYNDDIPYRELLSPNYVYGGGGLFCGLYNYENVKTVFKNNQFQKIIILPSSFYNCDSLLEIFDEKFIVFCREEQSFNYCTLMNKKAKFILAHDMAFNLTCKLTPLEPEVISNMITLYDKRYSVFLYESYSYFMVTNKNITQAVNEKAINFSGNLKLGIMFRADIESNISEDDKNKYLVNSLDLSSFGLISCTDPGLVKALSLLFIQVLNYYDIILTDRLHIGITSALLGKRVYLLDNSYGKLSGVYKQSMNVFNNVKMISSLSESEEEIGNNYYLKNNIEKNTHFSLELTFQEFLAIYFSAYNPSGIVTKTFLNTIKEDLLL